MGMQRVTSHYGQRWSTTVEATEDLRAATENPLLPSAHVDYDRSGQYLVL